MRSTFASFTLVSCCVAPFASADVILTINPSTVTLNEPTEVIIALRATDAFAVVVERIAFDFDRGAGGGEPTDGELIVSDFHWFGKLDNPNGKCALSDLPEPHTACTDLLIPWGNETSIAAVTITGTSTGVFVLAPNVELISAIDGSMVTVQAGDSTPIEVVPEPTTLAILIVFGSMIVACRSRSCRRGARLALGLVSHT